MLPADPADSAYLDQPDLVPDSTIWPEIDAAEYDPVRAALKAQDTRH